MFLEEKELKKATFNLFRYTEHFMDLERFKHPSGNKVVGSNQFSLLYQLPLKIKLALKVVKSDSKISIPFVNLYP